MWRDAEEDSARLEQAVKIVPLVEEEAKVSLLPDVLQRVVGVNLVEAVVLERQRDI